MGKRRPIVKPGEKVTDLVFMKVQSQDRDQPL